MNYLKVYSSNIPTIWGKIVQELLVAKVLENTGLNGNPARKSEGLSLLLTLINF